MSRLGKITRRTLLVGSAAIAGGVAVGYYFYQKPFPNPLLGDLQEGEVALTPYVLIDAEGVTIITPRADVGQGAYSVLAALVAEELDIAWQDIRVDHGPPGGAYYNAHSIVEAFPVAATDHGFVSRAVHTVADIAGQLYKVQVTGGSTTVPDAFEKMRVAGATARQVLMQAAAEQSGSSRGELTTRDGHVVLPDGSELSYSSLAASAANLPLPEEVTLKPESEWRYLGKPMQRVDIAAKSTGTASYGIDLQMPDMVHATVRTNPRIGGGIVRADTSAAESARGVLKVVEIDNGFGVIADNTWRAFQAASLIDVEWGPASYPASSEEIWEEVAECFSEDFQEPHFKNDGDVEAALAVGNTIEAEYRVPYLAHAAMEPLTAVALLQDGRLDIWTGTQIPLIARDTAARISGLDAQDVHIHTEISGGSFGRRLEDDYVGQAVRLAQAMPGRPVKLTWSREEDMTHDMPRPLAIARGRGAVRDGHVDAFDLSIASHSVAAAQTGRWGLPFVGPDILMVAGAWDQPFSIPNYRVTGYRVPAMMPIGAWRSVGASGNAFHHECFLDELIAAAGADPLEERIRLCWHEPSRKVLEAVGEISGWGSDLEPGRGRGIAYNLSFGVPAAEVVEVTDTGSGIRIDAVYVAVDVGKVLDPVNLENQVQGGVVWGLGHAMNAELTYEDGAPEQTNFHAYEGMRLYQTPHIEIRALENADAIRGIGEPSVPPAAPALANAIFAATGTRVRELPLNKHVRFV